MARLWPVLSGIVTFGASTVDVFAQPTPDDGSSPGPALGFSCKMGKQHELDDVEAGTGTLDLLNLRGHYTPGNSGSPYYPNVRPMRPFTLTATYAATTYPVFSGFVERFPTAFDGKYARSATVLVDGLSKLARTPLPSAADGECRLDNPTCLYRLDEPSSSTSAGDSINPGVNPAAVIMNGKYGGGTATFGAATGLVDGATGLSVTSTQVGIAYGACTALSLAYNTRKAPFVPTSGGWTIEMWAVFPSAIPTAGTQQTLMLQTSEDGQYVEIFGLNGAFGVAVGNTGLPTASLGIGPSNVFDGKMHHIVCTFGADQKTVGMFVDAANQGNLAAASALSLDRLRYHSLGARVSGTPASGYQFNGTIARYAIYPTVLSQARVTAHYQAGKTGFAGESSGTRVGRLLDYAGWPTPKRTLQTGDATMGAALIAGVDAFTAIKAVAETEMGLLFVDGSGNVVFRSRSDRWTRTTPAYVLGDDSGGLNNILSLENFSFEGGTVGTWSGANFGYTSSTIANTATFAQIGTRALQVTLPTAGAAGAGVFLNVSGLTIGTRYTMSVWVRVPTGTPAIRMAEAFGSFSMVPVSGFVGTTTVNNAMQRLACTFVASTATPSLALIANTASTAGQIFVIDGAMLEIGAAPSSTGMEIPFDPDIEFDNDPALLINDVTVAREGGATVRAVDGTSVTDYGNSGTTRTSNAYSDGQAADQANWLIGQFKDPELRISKLRIDAGANPVVFPQVLAMQLGDRVTVHRRSAQNDITGDFFIESKEITEDSKSFYVDLALNPADSPHVLLWDVDNWDDANAVWGF